MHLVTLRDILKYTENVTFGPQRRKQQEVGAAVVITEVVSGELWGTGEEKKRRIVNMNDCIGRGQNVAEVNLVVALVIHNQSSQRGHNEAGTHSAGSPAQQLLLCSHRRMRSFQLHLIYSETLQRKPQGRDLVVTDTSLCLYLEYCAYHSIILMKNKINKKMYGWMLALKYYGMHFSI